MVLAKKQEGSSKEIKKKFAERKNFKATVCMSMTYRIT